MEKIICSKRVKIIFVLLVITTIAMIPFAMPGIESGSTDLFFHLWRIEAIKDGLSNGLFPVKIYGTILDGSGYASGVFYPDLFLYIPAVLRLLGFSVAMSYKLLILFITFLTAVISYRVATYITDDAKLSLVFSFIWTTCNYRLEDVFNRAALGEGIALTFFPLAIGGLLIILYARKDDSNYRGMLWLTIGMTGIIQSHILSTEMIAIFMVLIIIMNIGKILDVKKILCIVKSALLTVLLNVWFLVPFLDYMMNEKVAVTRSVLHIIQMQGNKLKNILPFIDTEITVLDGSLSTTQPKTIGFSMLFLLILIVCCLVRSKNKKEYIKSLFMILIGLWLSSCYFPYDYLCKSSSMLNSLLGTMQFPWRWLGVVSVIILLTWVYSVSVWNKEKISKVTMVVAVFVTIISAMQKNVEIISYHKNSGEISYIGQQEDIPNAWNNQIMGGEYVPLKALNGNDWFVYEGYNQPEAVKEYSISGNICKMRIENGQGDILTPFLFYTGYEAKDEGGKALKINCSNDGFVQVILDENYNGNIIVEYKEKVSWRIAEWISVIFVVIFIGYIFYREKSKCREF